MGDLGGAMIREAKKGSNEVTKQRSKEIRKQGSDEEAEGSGLNFGKLRNCGELGNEITVVAELSILVVLVRRKSGRVGIGREDKLMRHRKARLCRGTCTTA